MLRFWEPREYFVVAGFSNSVTREANVEACRQAGVGIFRRCSGGGTVLQGPGCLNYALALGIEGRPELETIPAANRHIMGRHRDALSAALGRKVEVRGVTDLAIDGKKFSGNAQRRKRRALIFHGAFLLEFDLGADGKIFDNALAGARLSTGPSARPISDEPERARRGHQKGAARGVGSGGGNEGGAGLRAARCGKIFAR